MDLLIKAVPEEQVKLLRERAKANHRSLEGESRAILDGGVGPSRPPLSVDEIAEKAGKLGLSRRDEAALLIREDRDR